MSSFRGLGTMQSSEGFRWISRSFTARSRACLLYTSKRARFYSGGRQVNIPWGAVLDEQDGSLYWQGRPLCRISSQNAYDYFSRNDDGNGKLRGQLVGAILSRLERRDANYQARWDRVWESPLCQPYKLSLIHISSGVVDSFLATGTRRTVWEGRP